MNRSACNSELIANWKQWMKQLINHWQIALTRVNESHSSVLRIASSAPRTSRQTPFFLSILITCSRKWVTTRQRSTRFSIWDFLSSCFSPVFLSWLNMRFYRSIIPSFYRLQYSSYPISSSYTRWKSSCHPFFIRSIVCSLRRSITIEERTRRQLVSIQNLPFVLQLDRYLSDHWDRIRGIVNRSVERCATTPRMIVDWKRSGPPLDPRSAGRDRSRILASAPTAIAWTVAHAAGASVKQYCIQPTRRYIVLQAVSY